MLIQSWLLERPPIEIALAGVCLVAILSIWAAFTLTRLPSIELVNPERYDEVIDQTPGILWRIGVTNSSSTDMIRNMEITLDRCDLPELRLLPITLHRMHDNPPDGVMYQRQWNARPKERLIFDLLATSGNLYYLFRSDGDPLQQQGPDWMLNSQECDALNTRLNRSAVSFTVRAIADPPVGGVERDYVLEIGDNGVDMHSNGPTRPVEDYH